MTNLNPKSIQVILDALPDGILPLSNGLDHLGVAVETLDAVLPLYRDLLGLVLHEIETVESDQVRVAMFELGGGAHLELLEPTSEDSPVRRFIDKRGPGLHHIALKVTDCETALSAAAEAGLVLIDKVPRPGAGGKKIGFLHPKSTGGVLLELCERV